jgi:hypothetical protein
MSRGMTRDSIRFSTPAPRLQYGCGGKPWSCLPLRLAVQQPRLVSSIRSRLTVVEMRRTARTGRRGSRPFDSATVVNRGNAT